MGSLSLGAFLFVIFMALLIVGTIIVCYSAAQPEGDAAQRRKPTVVAPLAQWGALAMPGYDRATNPATGLPMVGDIDAAGNPFGIDND